MAQDDNEIISDLKDEDNDRDVADDEGFDKELEDDELSDEDRQKVKDGTGF